MSKVTDVAWGRGGGHNADGDYKTVSQSLAIIDECRRREMAKKAAGEPYQWYDGPWPPEPAPLPPEGLLRMATARLAAGVRLSAADRAALEGASS